MAISIGPGLMESYRLSINRSSGGYKEENKEEFMKQRSNKIHIYVLRKLVVSLLVLSCSLAYGADPKAEQNNQKPPEPAGDIGTKRTPDPIYELFKFNPMTDILSVSLSFHHQPNEEETALIMKYASKNNLKKVSFKFLPTTIWILVWDEPKDYNIATRICDNFPKPPSLKACSLNRPTLVPVSISTSQPPPIQYDKDLCGLAKDHQTYWAQNIIGADLLREELKKKSRK